ncbi:HipA N-terminal domain-containing protein [Denitrificimonas caeni]|uniref:HipA N-terminal domain-containing protein n=1 Tax=Denitrificimonas caeni TaxID=521720 RepID=UPI001965B7F9|nr:HipA N-terminal domain-containing protein [Denitrificimonas caeni]
MAMKVINVRFKSLDVGAVSFDTSTGLGAFEYDPGFTSKGIELSPLKMPLEKRIYSFPELDFTTFKRLTGLIADSLSDGFSNAVLNAWVAMRGKSTSDITPIILPKLGQGRLLYLMDLRII